jgi:tRNA nucleotidyltransferase (CCA-adding enzyme)
VKGGPIEEGRTPPREDAAVQPIPRLPAAATPEADGARVLERLREQPGGRELLELSRGRDDVYLVGGAVRDLLLGSAPRELDVALERAEVPFSGDAALFARDLASRLHALAGEEGPPVNAHERFGTAIVAWDAGRIDLAVTRRERYPSPGALPEVEAAPLDEDLLRRDFTVNAVAVALAGGHPGRVHQAPAALRDLHEGRLRVLHERSFLDDPTRLLRLARYRVRLGFAVEDRTAELAREAVSTGALKTLSGARIGAELRLALSEPRAPAVLDAMRELGLLESIHPGLRFELAAAERAIALLPADGDREALLLAVLVLPLVLRGEGERDARRREASVLLNRLEFPQGRREQALAAAAALPRLLEELARCERPSELYALAAGVPLEGVALAGALAAGPPREPETGERMVQWPPPDVAAAAGRWLSWIRHVRLQITGADLLAAGVPEGPEIGRRLRETLLRRLDGELGEGREAELAAALELP